MQEEEPVWDDWTDSKEQLEPLDYYCILNLDHKADEEEVKQAYRRLAVTFHPDKHQETNKESASKRFQQIQRAYDILSDPNRRHIYDLYGEEGLKQTWDIGPKLKTKEEIQHEYERKIEMEKQLEQQNLVKSKGHISIGLNASHMMRRGNVHPPDIQQAFVQHSWETKLAPQTSLVLLGHVVAQNGVGGGNVQATLKHSLGSFTSGEFSAAIGDRPNVQAKIMHNIGYDVFSNFTASMDTTDEPPIISLVFGRKITENWIGHVSYYPGKLKIGSWGVAEKSNSSCSLGLTRQVKNNQFSLDLSAGMRESHISISQSQPIIGTFKAGGSITLSTIAGIKVGVNGTKRVDKNTFVSLGVDVGAAEGVSFKMSINRLGQKFSLPIILTDEPDFRIAFAAFTGPVLLGLCFDRLILSGWRRRRKLAEIEKMRQENAEILQERKKDAEDAVRLMKDTVLKKVEQEEQKQGLVIVQALYGKLDAPDLVAVRMLSPQGIKEMADKARASLKLNPSEQEQLYIDVTIPVQALVSNGQLHIGGGHSKSNLIGFYDPCLGEEKHLRITYQFDGKLHQLQVDDKTPVAAPLRSHIV
ncbi:hypothetical protein EDD86DRAFT_194059 [Gorgonomyces haynaldii]|nr:hypothetical protein EDD86DRAFT_194059 [Gorgonomyces haynaldii]